MTTTIQIGDRVSWVAGAEWTDGAMPVPLVARVRQGKVVTITGTSAYVRTRRSSKPVLVRLDKLTKVQPREGEVENV